MTITPADLAAMRAEVERGDPPTPGQVMALLDEIARLQAALAKTKKLALEATNGWACFALRDCELDEISRIHAELAAISKDRP